jgi:GNAT superfamily N-acetyltransferase
MTDENAGAALRRLEPADLPAALAIQARTYPAFLLENEAAFASRLAAAAPYCLAAERGGVLIGYLLAHGWLSQSPPALDARLAPDAPSEVLFLHDLALSPAARGFGVGGRLVARAMEMAARDGLRMAELIAVEGAAPYWETLGFSQEPPPPNLAAKIAAYGAEARWMTRAISSPPP